jgi:5-methyltetrahydrofolate--homocysteine methyltransferase
MAFRAAALTRCAIDLALDAARRAPRSVGVAGVIGNPWATVAAIDRAEEECSLHAARLVADGCELIVARGLAAAEGAPQGLARASRRLAITSAAATNLPAWAWVPLDQEDRATSGEPLDEIVAESTEAGAQLILLEVPRVDVGLSALRRVEAARSGVLSGVLLAAQGEGPDAALAWAEGGKALADAGARVLGAGAGATADHVAALAGVLSGGMRQPGSPGYGPQA